MFNRRSFVVSSAASLLAFFGIKKAEAAQIENPKGLPVVKVDKDAHTHDRICNSEEIFKDIPFKIKSGASYPTRECRVWLPKKLMLHNCMAWGEMELREMVFQNGPSTLGTFWDSIVGNIGATNESNHELCLFWGTYARPHDA